MRHLYDEQPTYYVHNKPHVRIMKGNRMIYLFILFIKINAIHTMMDYGTTSNGLIAVFLASFCPLVVEATNGGTIVKYDTDGK